MKQGDLFLKIVVIVLCVLVGAYFLFSVLKNPTDSYTTYKAVRYEVGDGITTSGFVVRSEEVITSAETIVALTRSEGERVGAGQEVANCYRTREAQRRQLEIDGLEQELEQLQYAFAYTGSDTENADLDAGIVDAICLTNNYVNQQELSFASDAAVELKSFVVRRYAGGENADIIGQRITELQQRLNTLYVQANEQSKKLTVDKAGFFSGAVDGYETVLTPQLLQTMTIAQYDKLGESGKAVTDNQIGRLVLSPRWYFITQVDEEQLTNTRKGETLSVKFPYGFDKDVRMSVSFISPAENGKCLLVLTTDDYIIQAISLRQQTVQVLFRYQSGLRVPKEAIYVNDDGQSGVYVLEGAKAAWKTVEILYDNGATYLVALDKSSTDNLWPEDEIILTNEDITNGKVMIE